MKKAESIKDRIVRYGKVAWADVKPLQADDFKKYTPEQIKKLKTSIQKNGFATPLFIWESKSGNVLLDGFHRIIAFRELQTIDGVNIPSEVPALFVDCKDKKDAKKFLLIMNSHYAEIQKDALWDFVSDLNYDELVAEIDIPRMDFDDISPAETTEQDAEAQVDIAAELAEKWGVKTGQIWELGDHRILCGSSGERGMVESLLSGDRPACVFTDPPYGVAIGDKNKMLNKLNGGKSIEKNIESDCLSPEELRAVLHPIFELTKELAAEDCTYFVCAPQGGELGMMMMMMMKDAGLTPRHVLIWKKNSPTFSMGRLDYDYQHEPILLTWVKKHKRPMKGTMKTSIWEVAKPRANKEHPTMKPVELYVNAYLNNSDPGDVVYDPFSGSGTAIIAAENTGRKCRAVEIDPGYVAVAIQRWADATGKEPELIK